MSIVVGVNSYIGLAEFKFWAQLRNFDLTQYEDIEINAGIIVASLDFLEPNYKFIGDVLDVDQALKLPTDEVSFLHVENAVAYTVLQYLQGNLFVDLDSLSNQEVLEEVDKLGPLQTTIKFRSGSETSYKKSTQKIDRLLNAFTKTNNFGLGIKRG